MRIKRKSNSVMQLYANWLPLIILLCLAIIVSGCSGSDNGAGNANAQSNSESALTCAQMGTLTVPASAIGLATNGATVTGATLVAASSTTGEYCAVTVDIAPVDAAAPPIKMQLNLPTEWNKKAIMSGGGGYNGSIGDTSSYTLTGYAAFSGNSGHVGVPSDGSFAVNDEALNNYAYESLKKTRDVAVYLIKKRYAMGPEKSYFVGGSNGGHEAMNVVQRWPKDFNGAVVYFPANRYTGFELQFGRITRALAQPGAYLNLNKRKALLDATMQACDALDGVTDGLISNPAACNAIFDPSTATLDGAPLRCPGGADTGDTCLSDAQIAAMKVVTTPINITYPLASGEIQYPGFNWGSDFGRPLTGTVEPITTIQYYVNWMTFGTSQPTNPMPADAPFPSLFWDSYVKYLVTRDVTYNSLTLDPENPGSWKSRISELSGLLDSNKTDLSEFEANGGKILMVHGTADGCLSPRASAQYYMQIKAEMGDAKTDGFLRYYEIPGWGHGFSTMFQPALDLLTPLVNWVEKGIAPVNLVTTDTVGVPGRTRYLCEYPTWPKYNGTGDVNLASSFTCVNE